MATRRETNQNRQALKAALRQRCQSGELAAGSLVPSLRELAGEFSISKDLIAQSLKELVDEGLLYTVPRSGTFVGRPRSSEPKYFLLVGNSQFRGLYREEALVTAFESRIAQLGGVPLVLDYDCALAHERDGRIPALQGVLDLSYIPGRRSWLSSVSSCPAARVRYQSIHADAEGYDEIAFDDESGGRIATQHLVETGHRRIAFVPLHSPSHDSGMLLWSAQREAGWRQVVQSMGLDAGSLVVHPGRDVDELDDGAVMAAGAELGARIMTQGQPSAFVTANDRTAQGLLAYLRASGMPTANWPAIVGFDGDRTSNVGLLTSVLRPTDELGRAAADLLWNRAHGHLPPEPQLVRVSMRLIPRLTSRFDWSRDQARFALATGAQYS